MLLHTLYRDVTAWISNVVCDDTSVNAIAGVVVASVGPHTGWCLLLHTLYREVTACCLSGPVVSMTA